MEVQVGSLTEIHTFPMLVAKQSGYYNGVIMAYQWNQAEQHIIIIFLCCTILCFTFMIGAYEQTLTMFLLAYLQMFLVCVTNANGYALPIHNDYYAN